MYFYKTASDKKPLFYADNVKIRIDNNVFYNNDIIEIKVDCFLGRFFPLKKNFNKIETLVEMPPLPEMSGSVTINTINGNYHFPKVYCVMEAYLYFKRIYSGTQATYTYRNKTLTYRFSGALSKNFMEENNSYSVVFVLDDKNELDREKIVQIKNDWSSFCGFRRCKPEENCCFNELILFNDDDRWVTTYDDSVENNNALGLINQCEAYSEETMGHKVIIVSVYENEAMLIAYGFNKDIKLFFSGNNKYFELLGCKENDISTDYDIFEQIAENRNGMPIKEIFENTEMSISDKLSHFAQRLEINDYFIHSGFYDVFAFNPFEMHEFANGYNSEINRIRLDEEKIPDLFTLMYQGNGALEVFKATEFELGKPCTLRFKNIGRSTVGMAFCIGSDEIHRYITAGLKNGNIPIRIKYCHFTHIKSEYNKTECQDSSVSLEEYALSNSTQQDIYENLPFEMEYRTVFGKYALLYEAEKYIIPVGMVVNENNIKTSEDEKTVSWFTDCLSVNVTFTLESDVKLTQDLNVMLIPFENVYGGVGRYTIKIK